MIYASIFIILLYISYKDIKQRIIPNIAVIVVFILSSVFSFLHGTSLTDYFFYIFLASVPLLLIGFVVDCFKEPKLIKYDLVIIALSVITGLLVPFNPELKYVTACAILIISVIIEEIIFNKQSDDEASSLGGGDIKLIAALGPILLKDTFLFLFLSFLFSYIFMKIRKEKDIYLAPFICVAFVIICVIKLLNPPILP